MITSKEILSDFNLYYKYANAYTSNLNISNSNFPLSLFKRDLKRFDIVSKYKSDSNDQSLEVKNHLIVLCNCFGVDLVKETLQK